MDSMISPHSIQIYGRDGGAPCQGGGRTAAAAKANVEVNKLLLLWTSCSGRTAAAAAVLLSPSGSSFWTGVSPSFVFHTGGAGSWF